MISKRNIPRTTVCIVVLLVLIVLAYRKFEQLAATGNQPQAKRDISSIWYSNKIKYARGKVSNGVKLSRSINKDRNSPSSVVQKPSKKPREKPSEKPSKKPSEKPSKKPNKKPNKKPTTQKPPSKPVIKTFNLMWKGNGNIFYQEIVPIGKPKLDILLLHGQKYNSMTWVNLKTMDILASSGYRVIAMDLPDHGNTKFHLTDKTDKKLASFLANFISKSGLVSPVILSPSHSGIYALPYIIGNNKVSGFVPIAPAASDRFPIKDYKRFKAPTLIIRGSKDVTLGKTSMDILHQAIPHSETLIINGARHACYLDKPDEFHKALLKFLNGIVKDKTN